MLNKVWENQWVRAILLTIAALGICVLCYLLLPVLIPLFLAFLVAYLLDPVVDTLSKGRISRGVVISGLAVFGITLLVLIPIIIIPTLFHEADELLNGSFETGQQTALSKFLDAQLDKLPVRDIAEAQGWVTPNEKLTSRELLAKFVGGYVNTNAAGIIKSYGGEFANVGKFAGSTITQIFGSIGRGILGIIIFLGNFALFAFVAGYLLKDFDGIVTKAKDLVPPRFREKTFYIVGQIDEQIRNFVQGQMMVCLCLGVMYAVGLFASGVPFAILLAAFGALASFVPYLGIVLTILPATTLCVIEHGLSGHVIGVLATFVIAQMLEGTLITPKIVGEKVGLNPVWVILAILVFGNALGFLGLLLAVPIAASLKVLVVEAVSYYRDSPVFVSGEPTDGSSEGS